MKKSQTKPQLHPNNPHQGRYDFISLSNANPDLKKYLIDTPRGDQSIDFANPDAVVALNKAILAQHYHVEFWDLPAGYLCPPIPGRADHLHHASELLKDESATIALGSAVKVLDIGTGANGIYAIIGSQQFGWSMVGSEIDKTAIKAVTAIVKSNRKLSNLVEIRQQNHPDSIFKGIVKDNEYFDLTVCNPPFHTSAEQANAGSQRKWQNLKKQQASQKPHLNFGGKSNELWCDGGELQFVSNMINESRQVKQQVLWFTSLISKGENLSQLKGKLKRAKAVRVKTLTMAQGNKISRLLCWSYYTQEQQNAWYSS
ncbi:23S rRNA (adenine(1618)-N(6))-methyltransferase RlmF [Paraferrimonas sp. SM1919]|uniref:23S rRNA (adenine(1618)-N(6))-methyltransferase RlmF n=1 Tax=Paraferrimonas sp. SM1919 TaxID=2662263 RepID=UPI0013D6E676|nr:23S rRNA (adenine(1618)-N(6))-methyltransferase RlmF [Paraferrimonas sp. SM1919]